MALSDKQVQKKCLAYQGARQCRYLENDQNNWQKFNCVKLLASRKRAIDKTVNKYIKDMRAKGRDPFKNTGWTSIAIGNGGNCQGYLYLPTVLQGFDIKKT